VTTPFRCTLSTIAGADAYAPGELVARARISPGELAPVVVDEQIQQRRWGLLARFRGHGGKRGPNIDLARPNDLAEQPQIRDARRCLVLADGLLVKRGAIKMWVHPHPRRVIAFAVVTETSKDDGVPSFALVLGTELVDWFHDFMPAVVTPEAVTGWLVRGELSDDRPPGWRADAESKMRDPAQGELF
jgi:putative SOS response-associated peptidase YedK